MRKLFIILFVFVGVYVLAVDIDKRTLTALEHIRLGYVQYGFEELKRAAGMNDLAAQYYVAICYENGIGVEKSEMDAFKMFRKAAERGLPDAMYHIASYYKNGVAVTQDYSREKEWLQRYSQKGGQMLLPDLIPYYNEGAKHTGNYTLNPNGGSSSSSQRAPNGQSESAQPIVIVQPQPVKVEIPKQQPIAKEKKSDVDTNIPTGKLSRLNTFALIIANENYMEVANVPNAVHDGKIFAEYCKRTLGIPESNVRLITDATLNKMKRQLNWISQLIEAYKDANIIVYYAGHGIPDEQSRSAYLLPVDGYGSDITTAYSLDEIYALLTKKKAKSVVVLLDACFSGANRDGNMLVSARGVAIKSKQEVPKGNIVVFSASQGDETAYPYEEKGHGMFTYFLLKKFQQTLGDVSLGELADYVTTEVKKKSILLNGKMQTPLASPSIKATDWRNWKLK